MKRREFSILALASLAFGLSPAAARAGNRLSINDIYSSNAVFSDAAEALRGQPVEIQGYMAPPLKAESAFFVLTKMPMSVCPFCDSAADWPNDIVAVYTDRVISVAPFNRPILVAGKLELGVHRDEDLGFVSLVRLTGASFRAL